MSDPDPKARTPEEPQPADSAEGGVADALRTAVERTMRATAGSATSTRERAGELVDEVVRRGSEARGGLARRGQEAGAEIARRGQEAGAGLVRRGQEATGEVTRRLELLERRLAELEQRLGEEEPTTGSEPRPEVERLDAEESRPKPEAEA